MNEIYAFGKIAESIEILALDQRSVRYRLFSAAEKLLAVHPDMLPGEFRKEFLRIRSYLTFYDAPDGMDVLVYNRRRRRESSAQGIAKRLWALYSKMQSKVDH